MKVDALIIGAGQAASPLARFLADRGEKVALAEGADIGGSCVNYGCSPTKTIIASAKVAHQIRRGAEYGVGTGDTLVDIRRIMERANAVVMQFRGNNQRSLERRGIPILRDFASFEDSHRVRVGDTVVEADRIYINTGVRGLIPDIPGLCDVPFLDEKRILELDSVPEHLVIMGGGYIGVEYAQAMRRLGSQVTVIDTRDQILSREDREISRLAQTILEGEGIRFHLKSSVSRIEGNADSVRLSVDGEDGGRVTVQGTHLLLAVGRRPWTEPLALHRAGVETNGRGFIRVDDHLRTSVPHIYALGDVNGQGAFTHTSYDDYMIVKNNIEGGDLTVSRRITTYSVFMDPPLARVGMTEREARASGRRVLAAAMKMSSVGRATEMGETQGVMKAFVDADTGQILGATILGVNGDEAINTFVAMMYAGAHYDVLKYAVIGHPTVSELLPTMMAQLRELK